MTDPLKSVGVVLPTRELDGEFFEHCRQSQGWLERTGAQCIVCRPQPGLPGTFGAGKIQVPVLACAGSIYEAWNRGVAEMTTPYVYFSTVGDLIKESDLLGLVDTARRWDAEVVVARPHHIGDLRSSRRAASRCWPHEKAMRFIGLREARLLSATEKKVLPLLFFEGAMLGSSASNLYRTSCLRSRPFPREYGNEGDVAWFFLHGAGAKVVFDPQNRGSYRHHAPGQAPGPRRLKNARFLRLWRHHQPDPEQAGLWGSLFRRQSAAYGAQLGLERNRRRSGPVPRLRSWGYRILRQWHQGKALALGRRLLGQPPRP
jgi:hypothetical protein